MFDLEMYAFRLSPEERKKKNMEYYLSKMYAEMVKTSKGNKTTRFTYLFTLWPSCRK